MYQKMKNLIVVAIVALALVCSTVEDSFARSRGGGSRSSSRSSSRRTSSRSKSSRSSKPKSTVKKSSKVKSSKPKSTKRTSNTPKRSVAQQKSYESAKKNGTAFKSKSAAVSNFKSNSKVQKQYTSKYASKPASRPAHIPQSYISGGNTYNVSYNSSHGGFGYMNSGRWMAYDFMTMASVVMMTNAMHSNNYYYDRVPVSTARRSPVIPILTVFCIIGVVCVVVYSLNKVTSQS